MTPATFDAASEQVLDIAEPPAEIAALLGEFSTSARIHDSRSTYNIWVPSPPSSPNKVENLRTIINAALHRIGREELFSFICRTYSLKRSSVDSMLPFLRASGILVEVGRGVFEATPAARAWIESGDDLNFIRILHANMRFVGEMIRSVENDVTRNEMYTEASLFGLNVDKCRWDCQISAEYRAARRATVRQPQSNATRPRIPDRATSRRNSDRSRQSQQ